MVNYSEDDPTPMEEPERETPGFDEILRRFQEKINRIPVEYHPVLGWLYVYNQCQKERIRLNNRAVQMKGDGKRVMWASVLPAEMRAPMIDTINAAVTAIEKREADANKGIQAALLGTSWYLEVAVVAERGIKIHAESGALFAAQLLDAFGSMSRFQTIGQLMRYARLAPENGKAPKRAKGQRIHYNPAAFQALFKLSTWWNMLPECYWRQRWDYWKVYYRERYPADLKTEVVEEGKRKKKQEYPDGRILNMARRKVLREFLHDLWDAWHAWEAKQV